MERLDSLWQTLQTTSFDVLPIIAVLLSFQWLVLRRRIANLPRVLLGFLLVLLGLSFFLEGLDRALFPLGKLMAQQLTSQDLLKLDNTADGLDWAQYGWVYAFAFSIGFASSIAEPSVLAVAIKASEVSGGTINPGSLRVAVAFGAALGITMGTFRIVSGLPIQYFIIPGYLLILIQTWLAPRDIVALAYDSGGVTTSTVTVPLVTALGLGLATHIPGRNPMLDGFGLIAFTCLFPIMTVLGYAQLSEFRRRHIKLSVEHRSQDDSDL
jgi:Protein of unknown function (DUF1538)